MKTALKGLPIRVKKDEAVAIVQSMLDLWRWLMSIDDPDNFDTVEMMRIGEPLRAALRRLAPLETREALMQHCAKLVQHPTFMMKIYAAHEMREAKERAKRVAAVRAAKTKKAPTTTRAGRVPRSEKSAAASAKPARVEASKKRGR